MPVEHLSRTSPGSIGGATAVCTVAPTVGFGRSADARSRHRPRRDDHRPVPAGTVVRLARRHPCACGAFISSTGTAYPPIELPPRVHARSFSEGPWLKDLAPTTLSVAVCAEGRTATHRAPSRLHRVVAARVWEPDRGSRSSIIHALRAARFDGKRTGQCWRIVDGGSFAAPGHHTSDGVRRREPAHSAEGRRRSAAVQCRHERRIDCPSRLADAR